MALIFLPARPLVAGHGIDDVSDLVVATAQQVPPEPRRRDVTGAVLELLAEAGFSSLTFSGVATKSGVSTATLERYWGSRVDMVVDALKVMLADYPIPDTGSFADDAVQLLYEVADLFAKPENGVHHEPVDRRRRTRSRAGDRAPNPATRAPARRTDRNDRPRDRPRGALP